MYKELVERLRKMYTLCAWDELKNAADAIEKLLFKYNFVNMTKKEADIALKNEFLKSSKLEAENKQLKRERDQAVENLKAYEDIGLDPEEIKEILNAVNGGLAAENGIWCPKCGDALDIDIVNGVLAIGCFGCGEYTPVSELMKLHLNDAVPIVRCKDCKSYKKSGEYEDENGEIKEYWYCEFHSLPKNLVQMQSDDFCSYGERKESNE